MNKMSALTAAFVLMLQNRVVAQAAQVPPEHRQGLDQEKQCRGAGHDLEHNKTLVRRLFKIIYGTSLADIQKIDGLVAVDYIQHNPRALPGREGLKTFMKIIVPEPKELDPKDTLRVQYIAECDLVVRQELRRNGMLVDIFRVENGLLKEHWDAFRFAPDAKVVPGF